MLLSLSAKFDQLGEFDWYTYKSPRGTTLVNQTGRVVLRDGDKFGLNALRGGRYRVVLPDSYRSEFRIEVEEADSLISKSRKSAMPKIQQIEKPRAIKLEEHAQSKDFRKWDSDYFKAARAVNGEARDGVDFSNYQWRKINAGEILEIVSTKNRRLKLMQKTVIGVRFIKPATGGILIDLDGHRLSLSTKKWEEMLAKTTVMPKNKWPEGKFTKDQMANAREQELEIKRKQRSEAAQIRREEERAKMRERAEAEARAKEQRRVEKERQKKAQEKAIADRLADQKAKDSVQKPVELPDERILKYYREQRIREREEALKDIPIDYDDDTLDADFDIEDVPVESDHDDDLDIDENASVADDAIDPVELLDKVVKERRNKINLDLSAFGDGEFDEDDGEEVEDTGDIDVDDEEDDTEESEDDEGEQIIDDAEYEEDEDAAIADEELDDVDSEEDVEEDDEEDTSDDADADESDDTDADADSDDEDTDDDTEESEDEAKDEPYEANEGDIVEFKEDSSSTREFVILDVYPFSKNNKITIYKLYDITNEPEYFQTVRINTAQKRRFEDMVDFVAEMDKTEFERIITLTDDYARSDEPIIS